MTKITVSEKELEDYLCKPGALMSHLGLRLVKRQLRTPAGIIDLVAYNATTKRFVIIELKKDVIDYNAFFQLERYRHYLSKQAALRADRKEEARHCRNANYTTFTIEPLVFDCLLIGSSLSPILQHSVQYWVPTDDLNSFARMWYRCFNVNLERGLSVAYYCVEQMKQEQRYD